MNLLPKKDKLNFTDIAKEFIHPAHVSTNPYELESASSDLASLPFYHYKFKEKYLASHVVRPANTDELSLLIKKCRKYSIPVTVRAAGTSCYSSAAPTKGGVIIDVRRLNRIYKIDQEAMTVRVGSGISWLNLIEALADYGLAPKCYPTSFKTSCVSGFIATSGGAGIGVSKYGSIEDSIISLVLVRPDGVVVEISRESSGEISFEDVIGSYGIYGAISEVELSLTTLKTSLEITGYGFSSHNDAINFYLTLKNELTNAPLFISISERNFEKYSHIKYPKQEWLVWAVFYDNSVVTFKSVSDTQIAASKLNGIKIDDHYLKEKWHDINDAEVALGLSANNLVFQEYWISDQRLNSFILLCNAERKKYNFRTAIYVITGSKGWSRIKIFGLTDISNTREFFAVKAFLHKLSTKTFEEGDRLYTIGVVNSFYLLKFRPKEVAKRKLLKDKLDPDDLFNSYRLVNAKMKFWRINLLFTVAKLMYKYFEKKS